MTDRETLQLLEQDPETGMAALIDRYSGLLWKAASGRLKDPEDIRDCVSETFSEFYLHRENFDPGKGTLAGYLAAIARRRALRRWKSNSRQDGLYTEPDEGPDPFRQIEQRDELDEALSRLDPEDEKILRMKYYRGLNAREIAAALELPYETVKKRHQRSLGKLRRWLIVGLILALLGLLAACAYVVLRHFGIIPSYGIVDQPGASIYILAEPATAEFEYGTATIVDAILKDGALSFSMNVAFTDVAAEQRFYEETALDPFGSTESPKLIAGGTEYGEIGYGTSKNTRDDSMPSHMFTFSNPEFQMDNSPYPPIQLPEDGWVELRWEIPQLSIAFQMEPVAPGRAEDYSCVYHELAGLVAIPRREEGRLQVELYGMPTGEGYQVVSELLWGRYKEGQAGDITLTGADGRSYTGSFVPVAYGSSSPRAGMSLWDFGEVEPGEYALRVPYLFLTTDIWPEKGPVLPVDMATWAWEDTPVELPFGSVRITGLELLGPGKPIDSLPREEDSLQRVRLTLQWEPLEGLDITMAKCFLSVDKPPYTKSDVYYFYEEEPLPETVFQWYLSIPAELEGRLDETKLRLNRVQSYRWEQSFEMTITAG